MDGQRGFTLTEVLVTVGIGGIVLAIAVPAYLNFLPRIRLKAACRAVISSMNYARVQAIRDGSAWYVRFAPASGEFCILDDSGNICRRVSLDRFQGVSFGSNNPDAIDANHSVPQADGVSFNGNKAKFNNNGTSSAGTVYLKNEKGDTMAVGTASAAGRIKSWYDFGQGWKE